MCEHLPLWNVCSRSFIAAVYIDLHHNVLAVIMRFAWHRKLELEGYTSLFTSRPRRLQYDFDLHYRNCAPARKTKHIAQVYTGWFMHTTQIYLVANVNAVVWRYTLKFGARVLCALPEPDGFCFFLILSDIVCFVIF